MEKIAFGCIIILATTTWTTSDPIYAEEVYKWQKVEYEYLPMPDQSWIGPFPYYIPENNNIIDIGYHAASGLMVVVILRARPGVPIGLGAFCANKSGTSPKIWGFPNYEVNTLQSSDFDGGPLEDDEERKLNKPSHGNHHYVHQIPIYYEHTTPASEVPSVERIVSIFYVTIDDKCDRVFFMDNGLVNYYRNATYVIQRAALVAIGLPTNGCETRNFPIIRRSELPVKIASKGSDGFMKPVLDYNSQKNCNDLFLYIPNAFYGYLVVYDYKNDKFWSFDSQTFQPILAQSYFMFDKTFQFQAEFGIYPLALGPQDKYGDHVAFYAPMASTAQFSVSTKILKNSMKSPLNYKIDDFRIMGYKEFNHQTTSTVTDYNHGVMFFGESQSKQIRCWNINKPLNPDYSDVVFESNKLKIGYDVKIDSEEYLWFITNHIPVLFLSDTPLDLNKVNTRVFRMKVSDAIQGTNCADS